MVQKLYNIEFGARREVLSLQKLDTFSLQQYIGKGRRVVSYNLVNKKIARGIQYKSRTAKWPCKVKAIPGDTREYLSCLPVEMWYHVFKFLDPIPDLINMMVLCKLFFVIAMDIDLYWVDFVYKRDVLGNTLMHLAASIADEQNSLKAMTFLWRMGARNHEMFITPNADQVTPYTIAERMAFPLVVGWLKRKIPFGTRLGIASRMVNHLAGWGSDCPDYFDDIMDMESYKKQMDLENQLQQWIRFVSSIQQEISLCN